MFKILQVRLQQYVNNELLDFKMVLEKAEELDIKLPTFVAAAAAAKSLQSCPTLCSPIDGSPPATWFFSSCGRILELRRGSQPSPWVGPGNKNINEHIP